MKFNGIETQDSSKMSQIVCVNHNTRSPLIVCAELWTRISILLKCTDRK